MSLKRLFQMMLIVTVLMAAVVPAFAQDGGDKKAVTDDDVNNVARKLYCPVCENIPLDVCGTTACAQWRDEIRILLEEGQTPDQVINDFVNRFGDRVVGTPVDPTLRALSLVTPWVISVLAFGGALLVFFRWRGEKIKQLKREGANPTSISFSESDDYRARLERDLAARR